MTDERRLRTRDELLAQVRRDGTGRRRRFIAITSGSVLVVVAVIALVVTDSSSPPRDRVTANDPNPTTSTSTTVAETAPTTTSTLLHHAGTPTTTDVCRNSSDVACGPVVWDPPVHNQPGTLSATQLAPQPGDDPGLVRLRVTYSDPDSGPFRCGAAYDSTNPSDVDSAANAECVLHGPLQLGGLGGDTSCQGFYGTWDAPPPHGSSDTFLWEVHQETPGPHTIHLQLQLSENRAPATGAPAICDPYSELLTATLDIVVPG